MICALDSNIISYFLKNDNEVLWNFENSIDNNNPYVIPLLVSGNKPPQAGKQPAWGA